MIFVHRQKYGSLLVRDQDMLGKFWKLLGRESEAKWLWVKTNMRDSEEVSKDEQRLVEEIDKEIDKLKYFLEETITDWD